MMLKFKGKLPFHLYGTIDEFFLVFKAEMVMDVEV